MAEGVRGKRDVLPLGQQEWLVGAQCSRHSNTHQISRDSRSVTGSSGFWGSRTCELTLLLSNLEFNVKIATESRSALTHLENRAMRDPVRCCLACGKAIDLHRHAQALCNCLHEADLRCQLGYQISKDFPLELLKWAITDNSMPNKARYRAI